MFYHVKVAHCVYLVSNGQLGYFQVVAVADSTAMNILYDTCAKDSLVYGTGVELLSFQIDDIQC